jgi:hypothetical protein
MKKVLKVWKIVVIALLAAWLIGLSTLTVLFGEWGTLGIINKSFDDAVLGMMGMGCGFYLLVKLSDLTIWIITEKI